MDSMIVRQMSLPLWLKGVTILDENGDYNIYLNDKLSCEAQAEAFRHEVEHIKQGHFYRWEDVMLLEKEAEYEIV